MDRGHHIGQHRSGDGRGYVSDEVESSWFLAQLDSQSVSLNHTVVV